MKEKRNTAMIYELPNLIPTEQLVKIRSIISKGKFVDGMQTAGPAVANLKKNIELKIGSSEGNQVNRIIQQCMAENNDFQILTMPTTITKLITSQYGIGMGYGDHSDNAMMSDGKLRSDISLTVFLNDPKAYQGGELVLNTDIRPEEYKSAAGSCVIYPTYLLHRVNLVTKGTRLVALGWINSQVADPFKRQALIDLAQSLDYLMKNTKDGVNHIEYIRLDKVYKNLQRMWGN